jgi:hypothetical protein
MDMADRLKALIYCFYCRCCCFDRLIVEDRERLAQQKLETLLIEGLDSGKSIEATDSWWEQKRDRLIENVRQEQQYLE